MKKIVLKIKDNFMNVDFLKFLIIGVINTLSCTVFATCYGLIIGVNIAFILGYITSLCIGYILNSKFIFGSNLTISGIMKFAVSYIPNFIIQNIIVILVYNILGLPKMLAYIGAAVIGVPITFLCVKFFAFNNKVKG